MIVRSTGDSLQLIRQPDHAHLAGRIMQDVLMLAEHPRRGAILHAIAEHDNGWAEEDVAPMLNVENGRVYDFVTAPADTRQRVWPRGVGRLARDPWAAALVAQHALTVYDRYHHDPEWREFFGEIERLRETYRNRRGGSMAELAADYRYVRLGDLVSLVFCTGWTEEQRFAEWTVRGAGTKVVVTPDPFGGRTIPIDVTARVIPGQSFQSSVELEVAWSQAKTTTLRGETAGG
jgi:hypothetical protein